MKQLAQYQDGRLELQDVPSPVPPPGGILVRTTHSVISPGTEKMKVEQARMSLLQKAKARPDQVRIDRDGAHAGLEVGAGKGAQLARIADAAWLLGGGCGGGGG